MKQAIAALLVLGGLGARADQKYAVESRGRQRDYYVHTPPGWSRSDRSPLLLVFHGHGGQATNSEKQMKLGASADKVKFVVVYLDGIDKAWDDGRYPDRNGVDDIGYIDSVLSALARDFSIDPARVFAAGISNGGAMTFRLACERSGKLAGIAVVAMNLSEKLAETCKPSRPVPLLHIMGDEDKLVPFHGGEITGPLGLRKGGKVLSAEKTIAFWEKVDGCAGKAVETKWDEDPKDGTKVTNRHSGGCLKETPVEQILIWGGGHTWPKGEQYLPKLLIGRVSQEVDGAETILRFFSSIPKK